MAPDRPLSVEPLLPFKQLRAPETLAILQDAHLQDSNPPSQSPDSFEEDDGSGNEKPKRQKRSRACVACRSMKIRCLPVEGQEACSSCAKVNRKCIMPGPPKKRQKTVHKVAELEKKINALTDALLAKGQQPDTSPTDESPETLQTTSATSDAPRTEDTSNPSMGDHYERRFLKAAFPAEADPNLYQGCGPFLIEPAAKDTYVDVIDRGDLTMESATAMFKHWTEKMSPVCAMVVFPPGTEAQDIRTRRPMTFLTILAIASHAVQAPAQPALTVELNRQLSERVLFHGEKSLDLIQAMLLNCQYYIRPRSARDLSFNQYIHSAIVMCLELGIGKRSKGDLARTSAEGVELRRTWLACYQVGSTVATILRVPSLVKFNTHIEECLHVLSTSPYALPSDKWLCDHVNLQRIAEEVGIAFNMDDPGADLNFTEPRIQYQLKIFEHQLQNWENSADASIDRRLAQHQAACVNLYIHEIAIHSEHNVDDFRPGAIVEERKGPEFVTSSHVEALSILLESSHRILDSYLSMDVKSARSLPNLYIVWNTYAMVVLIKLHWIVNGPDSKLGSVFLPSLKTAYYLDAMADRLNELCDQGQSPCAEAFRFIYKKLKTWHLHRGGQYSDDEQGPEDELRRQQVSSILSKAPMSILASAKAPEIQRNMPPSRPFTPAILPGQWGSLDKFGTSDLNAAYDAASYGNTNWDQFNFSQEEMNLFDVYMNNSGWMGYLL